MITDDGKQLEALAQRESDLNQLQGLLSGAIGVVGAIASMNYAGAFQTAANTAVGAALAGSKLDIEKGADPHRQHAKGARRIQPGQEVLIDSAARVKTLLIQIPSLRVNALLAQDDIARLAGLLASQLQQAQDAQAALGRMQHLATKTPGAIPPIVSTAITPPHSRWRRSTTRSTSCSWSRARSNTRSGCRSRGEASCSRS